jgi:hypothetical protein
MRPIRTLSPLVVSFALTVLALPGMAQEPTAVPSPAGNEFVVNVYQGYQQEWGKVAVDPDGGHFAVAWNSSVSTPIWTRFFELDGTPITGDVLANPTWNNGSQDEPMCAADADGNIFVCWSDRGNTNPPNDGSGMGVFGNVFDENGVALGDDFQISNQWVNSQWEPMPAALPNGGWVVAWNGDNDGNAYIRFLNTDGSPRTGDILINTYLNNGQTEAEVNVAPDGTVLAVYADFGGNVFPFTGTNLFARRFTEAGVPIDNVEWPVHQALVDFDQLEPRMAAHANGFVIAWEDRGNDGSGAGVYARQFGLDGVPGPMLSVNAVKSGHQWLPEVAADGAGNFVVCWEDRSTGYGQIHARAYRADGSPMSVGFIVSQDLTGAVDYVRPEVSMTRDGKKVVFAYSGKDGGDDNEEEIYARIFNWPHSDGDGGIRTTGRHARSGPAGTPGSAPKGKVISLP